VNEMNTVIPFSKGRWDVAGVGASLLCVLHCIATPFLVGALPVLAATESDVHGVFAAIVLLVGMFAFVPGYRKHNKIRVPLLGFFGISLILLSASLPEHGYSETLETLLVIAGGISLIIAHLRNAYWCRFCSRCCQTPCTKDNPENAV
jgi:hypothetical protein